MAEAGEVADVTNGLAGVAALGVEAAVVVDIGGGRLSEVAATWSVPSEAAVWYLQPSELLGLPEQRQWPLVELVSWVAPVPAFSGGWA